MKMYKISYSLLGKNKSEIFNQKNKAYDRYYQLKNKVENIELKKLEVNHE